MELHEIVRVEATANENVVNELLADGWKLLSAGFHRGEVPGFDYHSYSLGLPKSVAAEYDMKVEERKKESIEKYGF